MNKVLDTSQAPESPNSYPWTHLVQSDWYDPFHSTQSLEAHWMILNDDTLFIYVISMTAIKIKTKQHLSWLIKLNEIRSMVEGILQYSH